MRKREKGADKGVKIYHKLGKVWENCDLRRKLGEGNEKREGWQGCSGETLTDEITDSLSLTASQLSLLTNPS